MAPSSDHEILARYRRRFAGIERQVPGVPPFPVAPRRRPTAALFVVPVLAAIALVAVGIPLLAGQRSATVVPSASPTTPIPTAASPAATGPSELDLAVRLTPLPEPSGIVIAPAGLANAHFSAQLSASGRTIRTWPVTQGPAAHQSFDAGSYVLTVWRYSVVDNVDTGARVTSPPQDACSIDLTLDPSTPKSLLAVFPWAAGACRLEIQPAGSPSPAVSTPSPAVSVECGPLDSDLCQKAVAVAEGTLPAGAPRIVAVRIEAPSALMTCPPSGGPPGSHSCGVMAIVATTTGDMVVGLVRSGDSWMWSNLMR